MTDFARKCAAFDLGLSFQEPYAQRIRAFTADVTERLANGRPLTPEQDELLLTRDPLQIRETLLPWADGIVASEHRLRKLLAEYAITEAYFEQRTWPDGQSRLYETVLDIYAFPRNPALDTPVQASDVSVAAIRKAFPVVVDDGPPLRGRDVEFAEQLRMLGNPWL